MVKLPRIYVRDSGIAHALLGLQRVDDVLGHPIAGPSWEGYVIENLLSVVPPETRFGFYRTAAGAEIDLMLDVPGRGTWAIDVTRASLPRPTRGFTLACEDLEPESRYIVYPHRNPPHSPRAIRHRLTGLDGAPRGVMTV